MATTPAPTPVNGTFKGDVSAVGTPTSATSKGGAGAVAVQKKGKRAGEDDSETEGRESKKVKMSARK